MFTINLNFVEETDASLLLAEIESLFGCSVPTKCNQALSARDPTSKGPVVDLLQPGLSLIFFTMQLATFRKYVTKFTDETRAHNALNSRYQDRVLAIILSVVHGI